MELLFVVFSVFPLTWAYNFGSFSSDYIDFHELFNKRCDDRDPNCSSPMMPYQQNLHQQQLLQPQQQLQLQPQQPLPPQQQLQQQLQQQPQLQPHLQQQQQLQPQLQQQLQQQPQLQLQNINKMPATYAYQPPKNTNYPQNTNTVQYPPLFSLLYNQAIKQNMQPIPKPYYGDKNPIYFGNNKPLPSYNLYNIYRSGADQADKSGQTDQDSIKSGTTSKPKPSPAT